MATKQLEPTSSSTYDFKVVVNLYSMDVDIHLYCLLIIRDCFCRDESFLQTMSFPIYYIDFYFIEL